MKFAQQTLLYVRKKEQDSLSVPSSRFLQRLPRRLEPRPEQIVLTLMHLSTNWKPRLFLLLFCEDAEVLRFFSVASAR